MSSGASQSPQPHRTGAHMLSAMPGRMKRSARALSTSHPLPPLRPRRRGRRAHSRIGLERCHLARPCMSRRRRTQDEGNDRESLRLSLELLTARGRGSLPESGVLQIAERRTAKTKGAGYGFLAGMGLGLVSVLASLCAEGGATMQCAVGAQVSARGDVLPAPTWLLTIPMLLQVA